MDDPSWTDKFVVRPGEPEYDFWRWVVENPARWSSLNQFSKKDLPDLRLEFEAHRSKVDREFQLLYSKPPLERNWRTRTGLSRVPKPDEKSRSLNLYDVIFYERDGEFDTIYVVVAGSHLEAVQTAEHDRAERLRAGGHGRHATANVVCLIGSSLLSDQNPRIIRGPFLQQGFTCGCTWEFDYESHQWVRSHEYFKEKAEFHEGPSGSRLQLYEVIYWEAHGHPDTIHLVIASNHIEAAKMTESSHAYRIGRYDFYWNSSENVRPDSVSLLGESRLFRKEPFTYRQPFNEPGRAQGRTWIRDQKTAAWVPDDDFM